MKKLILAIVALLALVGCSNGGASKAEESYISGDGAVTYIKSGDRIPAPAISGMTLLGTNYTYSVGKVGIINVWASWCSPCRAEEPALSALATMYPDIEFIGILTRDNPVNAEAFVRKRKVPYPTLIDDAVLIGFRGSLPANAIPSTVLIDKQGNVAARISGAVTVSSLRDLIEKVLAE
ncbi:MAG: TlpA family protein disulfide reductase [Candidatus Planktophila sp.]|nr:TlpA family protein disulfide reductase [Candidatus Planktophila sp.]MSO24991.1 TlpA family protein disulfide reductase [Candidatus Planktophila sp.]